MKTVFNFSLSMFLVLCYTGIFTNCEKESGVAACEIVNDPGASAFLKVINERSETIFVDMTRIIPLGAHVRPGACELYGMPVVNRTLEVTIEQDNGPLSKAVEFTLDKGETFLITVDGNFF